MFAGSTLHPQKIRNSFYLPHREKTKSEEREVTIIAICKRKGWWFVMNHELPVPPASPA